MQYLTQWRMQVAANLLAQSGGKVAVLSNSAKTGADDASDKARNYRDDVIDLKGKVAEYADGRTEVHDTKSPPTRAASSR